MLVQNTQANGINMLLAVQLANNSPGAA